MEAAQLQPANRRESLYYLWTASIVLIIGLLAALLVWFMQQSVYRAIPSKVIVVEPAKIPQLGSPVGIPTGRFRGFWLAHTDDDALIALESVEPKYGCPVRWNITNRRFDDPCHGYNAELNGTYIGGLGPAHDLNRYFMTITFVDGQIISSNAAGDPIPLAGRTVTAITVDVCRRIEGKHDPKFVSFRYDFAIYAPTCTPE